MPDTTHTHGARDSHATTVQHPLDGLTPPEIAQVRATLEREGILEESTRFAQQLLAEMPKDRVNAWKPGEPFGRQVLTLSLIHISEPTRPY